MYELPMNISQARIYRYNVHTDKPGGEDFKESQCAYEVVGAHKDGVANQCSRLPGYGPGELWCKQHARSIAKTLRKMGKLDDPGPVVLVPVGLRKDYGKVER